MGAGLAALVGRGSRGVAVLAGDAEGGAEGGRIFTALQAANKQRGTCVGHAGGGNARGPLPQGVRGAVRMTSAADILLESLTAAAASGGVSTHQCIPRAGVHRLQGDGDVTGTTLAINFNYW